MRIRHTTLLFGLLVVFAFSAHAEFDFGAKYAGDFMSGQSNARLLALGGVGAALAEGPSAVLGNPALLFTDRPHRLSLMHADRFESAVKMDHIAYTRREGEDRMLGFGLIRQGVDDIPVTQLTDPTRPIGSDNRVRVLEQTSASEYAFQFAYGMQRSYGHIGATAKLLYKRLYTSDAFGLGFDIGYAKRFGGLTLGAQVRDVTTSILAWDTGRQEAIVPTARLGMAYHIAAPRLNADITPVVELRMRTESLGDPDFATFHAGLEYMIQKVVAARVGVDDRRLTYGAGLRIGVLQVDYAFVGHDDLGATHRVSLGYAWGARE